MATTIRLVSNVLICVLLAVGYSACTDSEQQAAIDRQKRIAQQEEQEQHLKEAQQAAQAVQPESSSTPEPEQTPAEPEKVDNYVLVGGPTCQCIRIDPCGVYAWGCSNGKTYACKHDVEYTTISVEKTDSNNGDCS